VLFELSNELLAEIDDVLAAGFFCLKQVVVDKVWLIKVLLELVEALSGLCRPLVSVLEQPVRHALQPANFIFNILQVCL